MRLVSWFVGAGCFVGLVACSDSTGPTSSTHIGANLVELTVASSASEVVRGTPVTLQIKLQNRGTEAVTLHFGDSCQILPYIRESLGRTVIGNWGCLTVLTTLTMQPGGAVTRDFVWTGSTAFSTEEPLRPLPAGNYLFIGEVPAGEGTLRASVPITLK